MVCHAHSCRDLIKRHVTGATVRRIAVLMAALLPTMAFAAEDNAPAAGATAAQSQSESSSSDNVRMFSPEWREQKILDREENLRALDEEQRRFDRWEKMRGRQSEAFAPIVLAGVAAAR